MRAISRYLAGREPELGRLQAALESAQTGTATVVVTGEAGIGKTRLLATFLDKARDQGARVLIGACASTDAGVAFAPFVDALARLLREDERAAEAWAPSVRSALAPLLPGARLESDAAPAILDYALPEAIRSLAGPPLVLAVEDVHWADVSTRRVLDRLARSAGCSGLLMLVTARTGDPAVGTDVAAWLDRITSFAGTTRVELPPLDPAAVTALAQDILGAPPSPAIAERLARAEGNPLFVEQLLEEPDEAVPATVRQLAAARAARLPGTAQRVLRAAAVLGTSSTVLAEEDLAALTGLDLEAVAGAIRRGAAASLLSAGRAGVQFKHALLRDAVEEGLLPSERARLHSLAAARLEAGDPDVMILARAAFHRVAGGKGRPAVAALRRAGRAQRAILALPEAAYQYALAVEILDAERVELDDQADFLEEAAAALYLGTHDARAPELARRVLHLLAGGGQRRRRARLHLLVGEATWANGSDASAALAEVETGIAVAGLEAPAAILAGRARFLMLLERWREAERAAAVAVEAGRREGDLPAVASALVTRGESMTWIGEPLRGLRLMRAGRRVAVHCRDVVSIGRSYVNRLEAMRHLGLLERSAVEGREGIRAGRELGLNQSVVPAMAHLLVLSLVDLGRCAEADQVLEQADPGASANLIWRLADARGRLALARGDVQAALRHSEEAMAYLIEEAQVLEPCLTLRAEALLEAGQAAQALEDAERAVRSLTGAGDIERAPRALWLAARAAMASGRLTSPALLDLARELELRSLMPELAAYRTLASAELSAGVGAITAWRDAEATWLRVGSRPRWLYASLRLAQAELAAGSREAGRARVREVHAGASEAGFEGLARAAANLARRSRMALGPARIETRPAGLTPRELDVLRLLAVGHSNRQIAADLFISENTTEVHVSRVLSKLGLSRRAEAAAYAHAHHLLGG